MSLVFSVFSFSRSNKLAKGQVEIEIRQLISNSISQYENIALNFSKDIDNQIVVKVLQSSLEKIANSYDEACMKYLDNKVDKKSFKRMYFKEINNFVENENTYCFYKDLQSKYNSTIKVYKEWNNLEN